MKASLIERTFQLLILTSDYHELLKCRLNQRCFYNTAFNIVGHHVMYSLSNLGTESIRSLISGHTTNSKNAADCSTRVGQGGHCRVWSPPGVSQLPNFRSRLRLNMWGTESTHSTKRVNWVIWTWNVRMLPPGGNRTTKRMTMSKLSYACFHSGIVASAPPSASLAHFFVILFPVEVCNFWSRLRLFFGSRELIFSDSSEKPTHWVDLRVKVRWQA